MIALINSLFLITGSRCLFHDYYRSTWFFVILRVTALLRVMTNSITDFFLMSTYDMHLYQWHKQYNSLGEISGFHWKNQCSLLVL